MAAAVAAVAGGALLPCQCYLFLCSLKTDTSMMTEPRALAVIKHQACPCAHVYAWVWASAKVCACVPAFGAHVLQDRADTQKLFHTHLRIHMDARARTHTHEHTCTHIYIHQHKHARTHARTHTHTHTCRCGQRHRARRQGAAPPPSAPPSPAPLAEGFLVIAGEERLRNGRSSQRA